jgi:hypothetical protein
MPCKFAKTNQLFIFTRHGTISNIIIVIIIVLLASITIAAVVMTIVLVAMAIIHPIPNALRTNIDVSIVVHCFIHRRFARVPANA